MFVVTDHEMVMHANVERRGGFYDLVGHVHIGAGRGRVAGRVIMHDDLGGDSQFQLALHHFANIKRGVINAASLLHFVGEMDIFVIEKKTGATTPPVHFP